MSGGKSGTRLCSFKNLKQIGQGGFGVVYSAQRENGEKVAIKKIGKAASQSRIKEEIKTMKLLDHRNIVKFYEAFFENDETYVVMELCEGGSLMDYVKEKGPLDDSTAVHILRQLIAAVKYIHHEKFLHRDLSAGNVFIKDATKSKITVKLGDFGLATNLAHGETACTIVGTPGFIAPQVYRQNYDQSADVYSLGAVLYTMLTKHTPPAKGAPNTDSLARRNLSAAELVKKMMDPDARRRIQLRQIVMEDYMKENMDEEARLYSREVSKERLRSREPVRSSRDAISAERRAIRSASQPASSRRALEGYRFDQDMMQPTSSRATNSRENERGRERQRISARGLGPSHETEPHNKTWPIRMERLAGQRLRTPGGRYIVEMDTQCRFEVASKGDIVRRILVVEYDKHQRIQTVYVHRITDRQERVRDVNDRLIELTKTPLSYTSLSQLPREVLNDYNRLQNMVVCNMACRVTKITFRRPPQFPDASAQLMENGDLRIRFPRYVVVRRKDNGEVYNCINGENNREEVHGLMLGKVKEVYTYLTRFEKCLDGMASEMVSFPMVFSVGSDISGNSNNSPSSIMPSTSSQPSRFPFSNVSNNQQSLVPHSAPLLNKPTFSRPPSTMNVRRAASTDENTAPNVSREKYKFKFNPVSRQVVSIEAVDGRNLRCSTSVPDQFIFHDPSTRKAIDSRPDGQRFMRNGRVPERASEMLQALLDRIKKQKS